MLYVIYVFIAICYHNVKEKCEARIGHKKHANILEAH